MSSSIKSQMGASDWAMLLTLSVLWGGSFFFVEVILVELPPLTVVFARVALAAVALWIFALVIGLGFPSSASLWGSSLVMGLLNNVVPFCLISWSQTSISSSLASILNATTPLFTVVVAGVLLADERFTRGKLAGVAIGFLGVVVMIGPSALRDLGTDVLAQVAVLGGALSYAFAGVFGRRFKTTGVDPVVAAAGQVTASALVMAPIAVLVDRPFSLALPGNYILASIAGLAVLSTATAYVLYFRILASSGATNLLLVTFLMPVSVIGLGSLVLGETLEWIHYAGMALIGVGLSAIDGRLWRRNRETPPAARPQRNLG